MFSYVPHIAKAIMEEKKVKISFKNILLLLGNSKMKTMAMGN
jgi:hypothetical protein